MEPNESIHVPPPGASAVLDEPDSQSFAAARQICRVAIRPVYVLGFLLPRSKCDAVQALCAFCHLSQQALLEGVDPSEATPATLSPHCCSTRPLDRLAELIHERIAQACEGRLELPLSRFRSPEQHVLAAFAATVRRLGLPRALFTDLVQGWRAEVATRRYATWSALERHCAATGGTLAVLLGAALGFRHSDAGRPATTLGTGLRLVRRLCDVRADAARGRIFLPLEDLVRFGVPERALASGLVDARVGSLMRFEVQRARALLRAGAEAIRWLGDEGSRLAASLGVAMAVARLDEIRRRGGEVLRAPITLSPARVARALSLAWRLARWSQDVNGSGCPL